METNNEKNFNLEQFVNDNNEVEKVLRIEIENAKAEGRKNILCTIYINHYLSKIFEWLKKEGYSVVCTCWPNSEKQPTLGDIIYRYEISWKSEV